MGYFVAAERVRSSVSKKRLKRLSLFLQRSAADGERFPSAVADHGAHSAVLRVGEKTHRVGTIWSFVPFARRCCTRGGNQLPTAQNCGLHPDSPYELYFSNSASPRHERGQSCQRFQ